MNYVNRFWWLAAPGLVLGLMFWCQLHGRALGVEPVSLDIAAPWAVKSSVGWILAGCLLAFLGERVLESRHGIRHPVAARIALASALPLITLGNELLLLAGDTAAQLWLYNRFPLHLTFGALLFAGYLWLRSRNARHTRAAPDVAPQAAAPTEPAAPPAPSAPAPENKMVEVMTGTGRTQVAVDDIECLEADRNYINVHTPQRSYLLRQTLASLEKSLHPETFLRIHRSTIVNRAKIRERRRGGVLVLNSGRTVRVSRAFADRVN